MSRDYISSGMKKLHEHIEQRKTDLNLQVITGGGGDGTDLNWLNGMARNTAFVAKPKKQDPREPRWRLTQWTVANKFGKTVMMAMDNGQLGNVYVFVDPFHFSSSWECVEVLYDPLTMPPVEGEENESPGLQSGPDREVRDLASPEVPADGDQGSEGKPSV